MKTKYNENFCWERLIGSPEQFESWKMGMSQSKETLKRIKVIYGDSLNELKAQLHNQNDITPLGIFDLTIEKESDFWVRPNTDGMFRYLYILEDNVSGLWVGHAEGSDWYICSTDRNRYSDSIPLEDFMDDATNRAKPVSLFCLLKKMQEMIHSRTSYVSLVKWSCDNGFITQETVKVDDLYYYAFDDDFYAIFDADNDYYILPFIA